ncbi:spidroin-1 [Teleopsis dalmanni]|uniref:spidroin-1 n=1 Tax=Teleopsis dalmanni TaxID=139649 RepID=UPI0018CCA682|nr:spidroin-1 [Teleopsis dalmanni]
MNRYFVAAYFAVILAVVNCSIYGGLSNVGYGLGGYGSVISPLGYGSPIVNPYGINSYGLSPLRLGRASSASAAAAASASASGNRGYGVPLGYGGLGSIY